MKAITITLIALALHTVLTFPAQAQHALSSYEITEIAPLGGFQSTGIMALNDNGDAIVAHSPTAELDNADATPHLYVNGVSSPFDPPSPGWALIFLLNNSGISAGSVSASSSLHGATWDGTQGPDLIAEPGGFNQYYLRSLNDSGILVGYASFTGDVYKGFSYNVGTTTMDFDTQHANLRINNAGSVLRQAIASFSPLSNDQIELVRTGGTSAISIPAGYTVEASDLKLTDNDVVYGQVAASNQVTKCVVWKSPNWEPVLFSVTDTTGSCSLLSMNADGLQLIRIDGSPARQYVSDGTYFWLLSDLAPGLANYYQFSARQINAQGQISVQARPSLSTSYGRALILTGSLPPPPTATPTPTPTATPTSIPEPNTQFREALDAMKDTLGSFTVTSDSDAKNAFKVQLQELSALFQSLRSQLLLKKGIKVLDMTARYKTFKAAVQKLLKQKAKTFRTDKKTAQAERKNVASALRR